MLSSFSLRTTCVLLQTPFANIALGRQSVSSNNAGNLALSSYAACSALPPSLVYGHWELLGTDGVGRGCILPHSLARPLPTKSSAMRKRRRAFCNNRPFFPSRLSRGGGGRVQVTSSAILSTEIEGKGEKCTLAAAAAVSPDTRSLNYKGQR